ncbi:MAG: flagellar hook-associated protein FlgK [Sandaracinaceae bacterium]
MSLFGLLHTGATGLQAQAFGLAVTGQNVQNAGTEGYSRRTVDLSPLGPPPPGGGGVRAEGAIRIRDAFLEQRLLGARAARAEAEARAGALGVLDRVFADAEGNVGPSLDDFQAAIEGLAERPGDDAVRQAVLAEAEGLAASIRDAARRLTEARDDLDGRIDLRVDEVNGKLQRIGELGRQIARAEAVGPEAADLRDQRDQLLREVADALPIRTVEGSDGLDVLLGGLSLVSREGEVVELQIRPDPSSGRLRLTRTTAGAEQDVTEAVDGGRLGGLIAARDGAIAEAVDGLDQLAFDVAAAYNAVHQGGVGLDGVAGRSLFVTPGAVAGAAAAFAVSPDVAGAPASLAAAVDPAVAEGDNRNALELAALAEADLAGGGTRTANEELGSLLAAAGLAVQRAEGDLEAADGAARQLASLRESVSGVSSDEEAIHLARYQRGYQAALRVVQVADEMLQELLAL